MTKRKYREMVAAIILSVCVSMGAAPIDSLAAGGQITAFGESQNSQNASGGKDSGKTEGNRGIGEGGTGGSGTEEGGSEEEEGRPSDKEDPDGDENLDNDPDADTNNPPDDENPDSNPNDDQEKPEVNLPDDLVEPDLQNPELILKQDLLVPALYDALPKSNIPELISEDDDGSMIFILNGNGFDIGGYNGEDIIRSSYSGYATRILMADERTPSKLGFDEDMKEEINNLEISLRAEIIPIDGVSYVRLTLYVENTTDDEEIGFSLGIDADTCVGVDDRAKVQSTGDGILMLGRNFGNDGYTDYVNAFVVKDDDESDAPMITVSHTL